MMSFYRGNPFKAGIITLTAIAVFLLLAVSINASFGLPFNVSVLPPGIDYSVKAAFTDANGVNNGADVVIAGHTVGQVTGITGEGGRAVVTMRISSHYAPLHQLSVARIRYSTLLAQKYVEISPVNGGPTVDSGGSLHSDNTISPVDFDQFLSALDPETRARLQTLIQQAGGGLQGQHQTINDLLVQLRGLSQESQAPLNTFSQHDQDIDRIVANLGTVSARLAQSHQQLGDLVGSMASVTGTLASNDQALATLINHLGNVMGEFDATLAGNEQNLHTTVVTLDPLLGQLNGTLGLVYGDTQGLMGQFYANTASLSPETVSAVSQPGSDGQGNVLRQLFVFNPACDQPKPGCHSSSASSAAAPTIALPALPSLPSLPNLPLCIPTPSPPKLPAPTLSPLPCPSVSASLPVPTPSCMPTPKPTHLPIPTPSTSCPALPSLPGGISLPGVGEIPDWLALLLESPQ
jgi:phospholipid/cholesterol/gamma-HCH transport system substrate-binding protein